MRAFFVVLFLLVPVVAFATDCPRGAKECKVITLTPQEEQMLTAPTGVLATAAQARYLDLNDIVRYFREKIEKAPAGAVILDAPSEQSKKDK